MRFARRPARKSILATAVASLFSMVFAAGLSGQSYTTFRADLQSITERSRWNFGPFWIDPTVQFNLAYDSSIYGTYGGRAPVPDYIGTIAVPVSVYLPVRERLILTFTDRPVYQYFFETNSESSFNNSYFAGARLLMFHRLVLSGSHAYNRAKYRVSSEIEQRIFEQVEVNTGSLFFETPRGSAFGFVASSNTYRYQDELLPGSETYISTDLNRTEENIRFEFYRPAFVGSSYFLNFGYTNYAFESPQSQYRNSHSYQGNAGIRFPLLGRARGLLSLGYKNFQPEQAGRPSFSGLVGNTGLDFRLSRFGLRVQLIRDLAFSYYTENIYYVDNRFGAGLSYYLSRNVRLDYDFSAGSGDYAGTTLVTLPDGTTQEIQRKDTYLSHAGSLVLRILRTTGIGFRVSYWKRDSNDYYYQNQDRWTAGLFFIYDF